MVGRPAPRRAETRRPSDQAGHHTSLRRRPRLPVQARKRPHIFRPSAASSSAPINSQNSGQSPAGCTSSLPSPRLISSRFPTRFSSYPFRARYLGASGGAFEESAGFRARRTGYARPELLVRDAEGGGARNKAREKESRLSGRGDSGERKCCGRVPGG
ncbi:hypothetical protein MRX96_012968 [Rhipicephalus microplus]